MKTQFVNFEHRNKAVYLLRSTIEHIANTAHSKHEAINRLRDILPNDLKLGQGGSHVWCANKNNQRLFIIYF